MYNVYNKLIYRCFRSNLNPEHNIRLENNGASHTAGHYYCKIIVPEGATHQPK